MGIQAGLSFRGLSIYSFDIWLTLNWLKSAICKRICRSKIHSIMTYSRFVKKVKSRIRRASGNRLVLNICKTVQRPAKKYCPILHYMHLAKEKVVGGNYPLLRWSRKLQVMMIPHIKNFQLSEIRGQIHQHV